MENFQFFKNFFNKEKRFTGISASVDLPKNNKQWGQSDFLTANEISLYTNRAISKRADKVGEVEFMLQDKKGKEIIGDKTIELLYKPNKIFTGRQFWSLWQKYYDLCGEAYIYIERATAFSSESKNIVGLHLLNPTMVKPYFTAEGGVEKYEYKTTGGTTNYKPEEIIYTHNPDPKNPLRGVSLLKSGINAINTETEISAYHARILENGGKVEGIFKFKTPNLTKEQITDLKDNYQKQYGSAKKAGLPLFLGGDADYTRTGLTPEELSFLEAKKVTFEDICILTGVPKSILASTSDVKFDNADADRAIFLRETIHPLLVTLTTALDYALFPKDMFLTFVDPTPENVERKLKEIENGIKNYYMTINEARAKQGMDPISNGDDIMVPFNLVTLGTDRAESTKRFKGVGDHPLKDAEFRKMYGNVQLKRMDAREKVFKKAVENYFDDQEKRLTEYLDPKKTRVFRKKGLFDEALSLELEVKIGKEVFIPILTEMLKDAGIEAIELAGSKFDFNITGDIKSWLDKRVGVFLNQINETTFEKLKEQFQLSLDNEEGREKLISRIQETYGGIKKSRAGTIARTEVHGATQYGTIEGYRQGGLSTKIWVAVLDGDTRDSHASIDGEEKPIDMAFSNGLMFAGDPNGPAEEVINCRCVN
jgi:HK97 family phage portal protein